jgi:hypothetical protein
MALLVIVGALVAEAQESKPEPSLTGTGQLSLKSAYLAQIGADVYDEPIVEGDLTLRFGESRFYFGVWFAYPFDKKPILTFEEEEESEPLVFPDPRVDRAYQLMTKVLEIDAMINPPAPPPPPFEGEIDLYLGYQLELGDFTLDTSLWYYDFNEVGEFHDDWWTSQTLATYTGWGRTVPWLQVSYYGTTGSLSPPGGWYIYGGVSQSVKLFDRTDGTEQSLNLDFSTAWSDGKALAVDPGLVYIRAKFGTEVKLSKKTSFTTSVLWQHRLADGAFADKNEVVGSFGFKVEF